MDSFFNSVMNIVDVRIQHFKEHSTLNNTHNKPISRIKHKLKEQAKEFDLSRPKKLLITLFLFDVNFTLRFCKKKSPIHQHSN